MCSLFSRPVIVVLWVALSLAAPQFAEAVITAPIAYWSFDQDSNDFQQVNDNSGNGNVGLLFNGPTFANDAPAALGGGQSLVFDDAGDARTNMHYAAYDMSFQGNTALPQFTAAGWFKTSFSGPPTGPTVEEFNWSLLDFDRNEYFNVYVRDTDGSVGFSSGRNSTPHDMQGSTTGLNDGAWHHFAVVYDGNDKHVYVDGALDGTAVNPHGGNPIGSTPTRYGVTGDGSESDVFNSDRNDNYYDGSVDDLALWNTALDAADIAALAAGTAAPGDAVNLNPTVLGFGQHTIDFESLVGVAEGTPIGSRIAGMSFEGATLVEEGSPLFGFTGGGADDNVVSGPAGGIMITDISDATATTNPVTDMPANWIRVNWNGEAVEEFSFRAVDIDGTHELEAHAYDSLAGGSLLGSIFLDAGDAGTGDGIASLVDFGALSGIRRVEIFVPNTTAGTSGFALDTFQFTMVAPEPGSLSLALLSLLAVLARRRR